jgi:hypothetical protein
VAAGHRQALRRRPGPTEMRSFRRRIQKVIFHGCQTGGGHKHLPTFFLCGDVVSRDNFRVCLVGFL